MMSDTLVDAAGLTPPEPPRPSSTRSAFLVVLLFFSCELTLWMIFSQRLNDEEDSYQHFEQKIKQEVFWS